MSAICRGEPRNSAVIRMTCYAMKDTALWDSKMKCVRVFACKVCVISLFLTVLCILLAKSCIRTPTFFQYLRDVLSLKGHCVCDFHCNNVSCKQTHAHFNNIHKHQTTSSPQVTDIAKRDIVQGEPIVKSAMKRKSSPWNCIFSPLDLRVMVWVTDFAEGILRESFSHCAVHTFSKVYHS